MIVVSAQAFPPKSGGIEALISGMARHAFASGHEVIVLADGGARTRRYDQSATEPYHVERFGSWKPIRQRLKARRLSHIQKTRTIDAIYVDSWKSLEHANIRNGVPVVAWAHGNEFPENGVTKKTRISKALSKASHLLINSQATASRAAPYLPSGLSTSVINPPVEAPAVIKAEEAALVEDLWQDAYPRLFSMCRLIELKGIDRAIEALPKILTRFSKARYVIAGAGDDLSRLKRIADSLGINDRLSFIGWIDGGMKSALLSSATLFLQPGRAVDGKREGYGMAFVEAAAHGLPSIAGIAGGTSEAVIAERSGLLVDTTHSETIADRILTLLEDEPGYQALCRTSKIHGESCLWHNQIGRVLAAAGLSIRQSPATPAASPMT
ncbi:MAG: glycosyltransferase family 4 protein [Pseudomonadota bacterium]